MTIAAMKDYFSHRELGIQGAVGEYAILVPLVQWEGKLCLLFETRAETLVGHQPGEVCFPGGRREAGERPVDTALRETWEEIGIPAEDIDILAPLDVIQDISDRVIYPFLGLVSPAGVARLTASAAEVKNVFFVPLDYLLDYPRRSTGTPSPPRWTTASPMSASASPRATPGGRGTWTCPSTSTRGIISGA